MDMFAHLDRFGVQLHPALGPAHRRRRRAATSVLLRANSRRPLPTSDTGRLRFERVRLPLEIFPFRQLGFAHLGSAQAGQTRLAWRLQQHFWVGGLLGGGHLGPL